MKLIRFDGPVMHRCNSKGNAVTYGAAPVQRNTGTVYLFEVNMFAVMATPWMPTSPNFEISCRLRNTVLVGGAQRWYVTNQTATAGIGITSTGILQGRFASGSTQSLNTPVTALIDTTYDMILHCETGNNWCEALLQRSAVNTGTAVMASNTVRTIGGSTGSQTITGYIKDVRLVDVADPDNSVYFPMDEGAGNVFYAYDAAGVVRKPEFNATISSFSEANWFTYILPAQQPVLP